MENFRGIKNIYMWRLIRKKNWKNDNNYKNKKNRMEKIKCWNTEIK